MFIDYLTLMLVNMTIGLVVLAWFLLRGIQREDNKAWAAPFAGVGLIASVTGFTMTLTWPLPPAKLAVYNMAFGEMTVLFGVLFLRMIFKTWSVMRFLYRSICRRRGERRQAQVKAQEWPEAMDRRAGLDRRGMPRNARKKRPRDDSDRSLGSEY